MIRSMTGYGRAETSGPRQVLLVELKSVNHRHLDVSLKLPRAMSALEADARRLVQSAVQRGRVDVAVSVLPVEGAAPALVTLNLAQAREYAEIARKVADELNLVGGPTVGWVLEQPGVVSREAEPALADESVWPLFEDALTRALGDLVARREAEGLALRRELETLSAGLATHVDTMAERAPVAVARRTARLRERMQALLGETAIDEARIATEAAVWAEKTDIGEELARLRAHLGQLAGLLEAGGAVGRTLDFLIQEMNREANTVGAKADDLEISQAVIAVKSILEKLREQAQNIE
jgi:uncharacterized protein (TIGR00255 family)